MKNSFIVRGKPVPQPRQRHRISGGKNTKQFVQNYTPKDHPVQYWKKQIQQAAALANIAFQHIDSPVKINLYFFMPIPKSLQKKVNEFDPHIKKPDKDNLEKAVLDALTDIGVWRDDSLVYHSTVSKVYSMEPGVQIEIDY